MTIKFSLKNYFNINPNINPSLKNTECVVPSQPFVIAGPCSAESEAQILEVAQDLKDLGQVAIMRAGIWKPRTRPGHFEGVGVLALQWLANAKAITGLPVATEVAQAIHVEEALKAGVDLLWIGARSTASPFVIAEIAAALQGVDIPVLVKNPIGPDLGLWMGALERLEHAGIRELGAIHRGFATFTQGPYRNTPLWKLPMELKRRLPHLPLICDPSHITGKASMIEDVAQRALHLGMDGLMLEVHPNPKVALSDAEQQIKPSDLEQLLIRLALHHQGHRPTSENEPEQLEDLRKQIDLMDSELIHILQKRMKIVEEIGQLKSKKNLTAFQFGRMDELLKQRIGEGENLGLSRTFIEELFNCIHEESVQLQTQIMAEGHRL